MRIYLAGPMTGHPHYNFPAFDTAADALRGLGHTVFNPAEEDRNRGFDPVKFMLEDGTGAEKYGFDLRTALLIDLTWIIENADAIALLDGWYDSKGVAAELALANALNIPAGHWTDFDELGLVSDYTIEIERL